MLRFGKERSRANLYLAELFQFAFALDGLDHAAACDLGRVVVFDSVQRDHVDPKRSRRSDECGGIREFFEPLAYDRSLNICLDVHHILQFVLGADKLDSIATGNSDGLLCLDCTICLHFRPR